MGTRLFSQREMDVMRCDLMSGCGTSDIIYIACSRRSTRLQIEHMTLPKMTWKTHLNVFKGILSGRMYCSKTYFLN